MCKQLFITIYFVVFRKNCYIFVDKCICNKKNCCVICDSAAGFTSVTVHILILKFQPILIFLPQDILSKPELSPRLPWDEKGMQLGPRRPFR